MSSVQWDPLLTTLSIDPEIINAATKRQIKNILKSYVGLYDTFSELIQNSMDAVDKRKNELCEKDYIPHLWITINLKENFFSITDNGIAFNEKEFKSFLAPNISFKDYDLSRGNKGVGATYLAYGFDFLQFGTKGNGYNFVGELIKGREWVEDFKGIITRPVVIESHPLDENYNEIDRGSTFTVKFGGEHSRPKTLKYFSANTAEQWLYILLLKTPLGCIYFSKDSKDYIKFDLMVIDANENITTLNNVSAEYIYPHQKIIASIDLKNIIKLQEKLLNSGKDPSNIPSKFLKSNALYEYFSEEDIIKLLTKDIEKHSKIISIYEIEAYGYFVYSTNIWDQFNDKLAQLRKGYRIIRGGLQLANNRMIQGEIITIPLTSNIGYQNQSHIIIHFKNADPDLGRKGFQPELKETAEYISTLIVNKFKKWKKLLKKDTGVAPQIEKEIDLYNWIKGQEEHERNYPLSIKNENFFIPIKEISITSIPQSEQDVIVLFNQLIAGGVLRGIKLLATSQNSQYDGIFKFEIKEPLENYIFNKKQNPLGVSELQNESEFSTPPKILEYKFNLDALISEFESEEKFEKDISLIVTWELGSSYKKYYEITSLLDLSNLHQRDFHGLTHILVSDRSRIYVICLKELIEYLNDVTGVQNYHIKKYSEEII